MIRPLVRHAGILLLLGAALPFTYAQSRDSPVYLAGGLALDAHAATDQGSVLLADGGFALTESDIGKGRVTGTLAVGYAMRPSRDALLMVEVGKDLGGTMHIATGATLEAGNQFGSSYFREWSIRRDWYLAFKPGMQLNPSTTAYLSLAYHRGRAGMASAYLIDCQAGACTNTHDHAGSARLSGTGVGVGLQTDASGRWFARLEIEKIFFSRIHAGVGDPTLLSGPYTVETMKPSQTIGRALVGYRF